MSDRLIVLVAITKGVFIALLIKVYLATSFIQGLVTAAVSAVISGAFLLFSTHMMARKTEKKVEDATVTILEEQHAAAKGVKDALDAKADG